MFEKEAEQLLKIQATLFYFIGRFKKMIEIDLNNGMYRRVDLDKPCFCSKCHKEIVRNRKSINLVVNVHACGYVFCNKCKKKLNDFAGNKISKYENKLVEEFVNDGRRKDNV